MYLLKRACQQCDQCISNKTVFLHEKSELVSNRGFYRKYTILSWWPSLQRTNWDIALCNSYRNSNDIRIVNGQCTTPDLLLTGPVLLWNENLMPSQQSMEHCSDSEWVIDPTRKIFKEHQQLSYKALWLKVYLTNTTGIETLLFKYHHVCYLLTLSTSSNTCNRCNM